MAELGKKPCCNYTIIGFYSAKAYLLSEATAFIIRLNSALHL